MKFKSSHTVVVFLAVLFLSGCRQTETAESKPAEPVYFPASEVCSYPAGGPGKVFINLSGGNWQPSNPSEPGAPYECVGAKSSVQMVNSGGSVVDVQYAATGDAKGSSLISLTYTATGSAIPNESTNRNAFANLVEAVSRQGLGAAPPDLFRRKLSNLSSYSQPGKGFTENFDVGKGFISLTREASPNNSEIKVFVKLFPDVALKIDG